MEDTKVENLQWSLLDSVSQSSADTDRCIQKWMECSMSRDISRGTMVKGGTVFTHTCVRTESSKISTFDLQQTNLFESSPFSNRQDHCTTLPWENGGNRELHVTEIKQRNLAVSLETPDHNYCRISSRLFECRGRLAVPKQQGPTGIENLSKSISTSLPEERNAQNRFVCMQAVSPTTLVLFLETRSFQSRDKCPTKDLGQSTPLCISPILLYYTSLEESEL